MALTQKLLKQLKEEITEELKMNEPMSLHTSFKIGGPAEVYLEPDSVEKLIQILNFAEENHLPVTLLGNGSNLLVSDFGIEGITVSLVQLCKVEIQGETVTAQCGVLLGKLANLCASRSLSGLEFASGIPGSLGGAVYMNAGAYGGEMKDCIIGVSAIHNGNIIELSGENCKFGYRHSIFCENGDIILCARLKLQAGKEEEIRTRMVELNRRRKEKQPLEYPSAGSVFRRPEGYFAGTLIEEAGLKGYRVGGAAVSEKHAGFIINTGGATAKDVLSLIAHIKETVYQKNGVMLQEEIRKIGRE